MHRSKIWINAYEWMLFTFSAPNLCLLVALNVKIDFKPLYRFYLFSIQYARYARAQAPCPMVFSFFKNFFWKSNDFTTFSIHKINIDPWPMAAYLVDHFSSFLHLNMDFFYVSSTRSTHSVEFRFQHKFYIRFDMKREWERKRTDCLM